MGIGMGALIAGLFGMNVSPFHCLPLLGAPSYESDSSLRVIWKSTHMPLSVCLSHRVSLHFSSHGPVFESPFSNTHRSILRLTDPTPFQAGKDSKNRTLGI